MTNLVLIDCHDLGRHLGAYGRSTVPSPNLDALAADGVRFDNSFCTAPQCSPSRAGLYTGRYPHATGMLGLAHQPFGWRLNAGEIYLARYLLDAGYSTAHVGMQHVTDRTPEAVQQLGFQEVRPAHHAGDVADAAIDWLRGAPDGPFFLNIGFTEPHRDESGLFKQAAPDTQLGVDVPPYLPQTAEARAEFAELQGVIGLMDEAVGRIRGALAELDLLGDTWLIFTTDHGLAMPRAKTTLYDPGIETALIMYSPPFGLTGGRTFDTLISNVDLVPTILDMLGLTVPASIQGRSFADLLRGNTYRPREHIYAGKTFHTDYEPQRAIRSQRYKLIWNAEVDIINVAGDIMHSPIYPQMIEQLTVERPPFELYDLQSDPLEQHNRIDDVDYMLVATELRQHLLNWMQQTGDPILKGPIASPYYERALKLLRE